MDIKEFINRYKNDSMDENLLTSIYEYTHCEIDSNLKDVSFLMPIVRQLCYYKNNFADNKQKCFDNDYYGTYDLLKNDEKFIYKMMEKGFTSKEISEFLIAECKNNMSILLKDYTSDGEITFALQDEYDALIKNGLTDNEAKEKLFRGTYKLENLFNKLCAFIGL